MSYIHVDCSPPTASQGSYGEKETQLQYTPGKETTNFPGHFSCGLSHKLRDQYALKYLFPGVWFDTHQGKVRIN